MSRRPDWRIRVLVGLSPVWLLGGLVITGKVSASDEGPFFAGSAEVAREIEPLTRAAAPAGEIGRTAAVTPTAAGDRAEPARVMLASIAPAAAETPAAQPGAAGPAEDGTPVLVSPAGPEDRARAFEGWRTAPGTGAAAEGERLAAAGTVVIPQPRWGDDDGAIAAAPIPEPRPDRLRARAPVERPPLPRAAERADRPAIPERISDARVVIHHGTPEAASAARRLSEVLDVRGVGETELRGVDAAPSDADVRYFHERDRAAAEAVNRLLRRAGYGSELKDFTHFDPPPSPGTVEVWLPG